MTTIGNNLTVDGTITANQATQAGEAVVLGEDGLIPASLLPSTGGEQWEEIPYDSTMISGGVYKIRCTSGSTEFVNNSGDAYQSVFFPSGSSTATVVGINQNVIDVYRIGGISQNLSSSKIKLYRLIS